MLLGSPTRASQVSSTTTPSSSTMGLLLVGLRRSNRSLPPWRSALLDIGLCIARNKTEAVLACTSVQNFSPHDFESFAWVPDGNIKLLGAAIGSLQWCETLLKRRVLEARNLLDAIGRYPDAQGAFSLLHSCSGWAKVLYSCLRAPPPLQADGLSQADQDIRHSLGRLVGTPFRR